MHLEEDLQKLKDMAEIFKNPLSFTWHVGTDLWVNRVEIYDEVHKAMDAYSAEEWRTFGDNVGRAAAKTFLGEESQLQVTAFHQQAKKEQVASILQGVLEAFGGNFDLMALLECIYAEDQAALMFDVAF